MVHDVMVVKAHGEFIWPKHDDTDDLFLVLTGPLDIELRDGVVTPGPGRLYVVPRDVEHRPVAREEVHLLLIEPSGTLALATLRPPPPPDRLTRWLATWVSEADCAA